MRVIGFNFKKFEAERKKGKKGQLKINSNIDITNIEKEDFSLVDNKTALRFDFNFSIIYEPNAAKIELGGYIVAVFEKDKVKKIQKNWDKNNLSPDVKKFIFNFILNKCNLKALELEDEFGLPPHIPMPKIKDNNLKQNQEKDKNNKKSKKKSYTG